MDEARANMNPYLSPGSHAADADPPFSAAARAIPVIDVDIPCFGCRYNLRSRALQDRCPECGAAVTETLKNGWLSFADENWLRQLHRGTSFFGYALISSILLFPAVSILNVVLQGSPISGWAHSIPGFLFCTFFYGGFLLTAWLLSSPQSLKDDGQHRSLLPAWIRALFVMATVIGVLIVLWPGSIFDPNDTTQFVFHSLAMIFCAVAFATGTLLLCLYLRSIARRDIRGTSLPRFFGLLAGSTVFLFFGIVVIQSFLIALARLPGVMSRTVTTSVATSTYSYTSTQVLIGPAVTTQSTSSPTPAPPAVSSTRLPGFGVMMTLGSCMLPLLALTWIIAAIIAIIMLRKCLHRAMTDPLRTSLANQIKLFAAMR